MVLQFLAVIIANNSVLSAKMACTVLVIDVPEPPEFVGTALEVQQSTAFPSSEIGSISVVDEDGMFTCVALCPACTLMCALLVCSE